MGLSPVPSGLGFALGWHVVPLWGGAKEWSHGEGTCVEMRRRRLPMAVVADRAFTSRATLQRVEAGDPSVGMGIYAAVLNALGLLDGLARLADPATDEVGQALTEASLPQRVRLKSKEKHRTS